MLFIKGIVLFLFIPVVLYLFLTFPLGILPSLIIGIFLMFGHRFIARPFMQKNRDKRCIWSGKLIKTKAESFILREGENEATLYTVNKQNKDFALQFFDFVHRYRYIIKPAILATLIWYLTSAFLVGINRKLEYIPLINSDNHFFSLVQIFKIIIAVTVIFGSFLYKIGQKIEPARSTFPVHNFFLLGIYWILWIFRIVGSWWIIQFIILVFK